MRRILAKTMIIVLVILFSVEPIFANPNRENGKSQSSDSTSSSVSGGVPSSESAGSSGSSGAESSVTGPQDYWIVQNGDGTTSMVPSTSENLKPTGTIGKKTLNSDGSLKSVEYFDEGESWMGEWIRDIADAIDQIVFRISLAIHPFPTSMFQLYGLTASRSNLHSVGLTMSPEEDNIHNFNPNYLLISNNYYDSNNLKINDVTVTTNGASISTGNSLNNWKLPIAENEKTTGEAMLQFTKWKTIVMLFATCFAAEILFMAVYGYATGSSEDGDSSLMKNVAKKIAITLMLMVLVSALPFLLEAFRIGLFEIAENFYGEAAYRSYNELAVQGVISSWDIPVDSSGHMKDANIFKLPGLFLRSMRDMFVRTTSDPMDRALSKQMEKSDAKPSLNTLFIKLVVWLMITIYRFLMFFVTLKATIHIAKNILEVYLLLSLVMILVPFSVFTPLKTLGSKCVMSLVSNLVECFIILVIILTIIPAIKITIVTLLDYSLELSIPSTSMINTPYYKNYVDPPYNLKMIAGDGYVAVMAHTGIVGNKIGICWTYEKKGYESVPGLKDIFDAENVWVVMDISKIKGDPQTGKFEGLTKDHILEIRDIDTPIVQNDYTLSYDNYVITVAENGGNSEAEYRDIYLLPTENTQYDMWKYTLAGQFASALYDSKATLYNWAPDMPDREDRLQDVWNAMLKPSNEEWGYSTILQTLGCLLSPIDPYDVTFTNDPRVGNNPSSEVTEYSSSGKMTDKEATSFMFLQLTLVFLGLFLPSYFVQQSTQITNALMNGSAGMESLANAMGQTLSKAVGMTGKLISAGLSVVGNLAGAAMGMSTKAPSSKGNEQSTLSSMTDQNG